MNSKGNFLKFCFYLRTNQLEVVEKNFLKVNLREKKVLEKIYTYFPVLHGAETNQQQLSSQNKSPDRWKLCEKIIQTYTCISRESLMDKEVLSLFTTRSHMHQSIKISSKNKLSAKDTLYIWPCFSQFISNAFSFLFFATVNLSIILENLDAYSRQMFI